MNLSMSQMIATMMASSATYAKPSFEQPYHLNGCRNGVRPMFKQNKRAEAKRRNK